MTLATNDLRSAKGQRGMMLAEYLDYDDGSDRRYELENGILIDMSSEHPLNPIIAMFLLGYLLQELKVPLKFLVIGHQIEVRSTAATCRQPDLIIHSSDSLAAILSGDSVLRLEDPSPLFVVEVASSTLTNSKSRKRDYELKPREYADRGISEMWIIDPDRQWVQVGSLLNHQYEFKSFMGDDKIISPTFPALNLTANQVLQTDR